MNASTTTPPPPLLGFSKLDGRNLLDGLPTIAVVIGVVGAVGVAIGAVGAVGVVGGVVGVPDPWRPAKGASSIHDSESSLSVIDICHGVLQPAHL